MSKMVVSFPKIPNIRIILHCLLTIFVTAKVLVWNYSQGSYVRSLQETFEFIFTDPILEIPRPQRVDLFGYNETAFFVARLIEKYQQINNLSTTEFAYGTEIINGKRDCVGYPLPVQWTTCMWTSVSNIACSQSNINSSNEYPIAENSFYNNIDSFKLTFDLCNYVNTYEVNHDCHYWRVDVTFRSVSLMYLQTTVASTLVDECEQSHSSAVFVERPSNWLNMLSIFVCAVYLVYIIYDIVESIRIYYSVKEAHQKAHAAYLDKRVGEFIEHEIAALYSWEEIPRGVKRSFHNYWSFFTLFAVVLAISQAGVSLFDPYDDLENLQSGQKALVGISILFLWMSVVQFIPIQSPVYAVAATVQTAFPRIFAFLLSFIPVFLAFVFFGITLFGAELGSFGSVDRAAKYIFTLMAGDSVMQIMQMVRT